MRFRAAACSRSGVRGRRRRKVLPARWWCPPDSLIAVSRVATRLDAGTKRRAGTLGSLAVYCCLSFAYFGAPIVAHPRSTLVGDGNDPSLYVWSMAWWPHAIAHGLNPLYPRLLWAPGGVNLAW